jgi:hypothetical protein
LSQNVGDGNEEVSEVPSEGQWHLPACPGIRKTVKADLFLNRRISYLTKSMNEAGTIR